MTISIIALNEKEEFLQHLDPDLCEIKETITIGGLRTISLEYKFQEYTEDKQLFKLGNKLWIQGDINLRDCLYVINTKVKQDIFKENSFTIEAEEVLVELNNAPFISHLILTGHSDVFKSRTVNGATEVKIDWNSLNCFFGDFFNMGVVQDCLNSSLQWIPFFGSYNLMSLLRYIEEQTGNVFVTRYEKDQLSNTIHRYLDFLNPINASKNWEMHIEYDFIPEKTMKWYAEDGITETTEDKPWDVVRYTNSHVPTEQEEQVLDPTYDAERDEAVLTYDTLDSTWTYISEDENVIDEGTINYYPTIRNITPANTVFRIVNAKGETLNADGEVASTGDDNILQWSCADIGLTTTTSTTLITLYSVKDEVGLTLNTKNYSIIKNHFGDKTPAYVSYTNDIHENVATANKRDNNIIPDDSYLEMYDTSRHLCLFRTCINRSIGKVHEEVLDFGFNIDNIQYDVDEEDVYSSVSPSLQYSDSNNSSNGMTRNNFTDLLTRFYNLNVSKGDTIPMIMQKVSIQASTIEAAKMSLGGYVEGSGANESNNPANYWIRPYKPNDNVQTGEQASQSTYEFLRATAYWHAPYNKDTNNWEVRLNESQNIEYYSIRTRSDLRDEKNTIFNKTGTTESSDEDIYSIYNQCALYLKEHSNPKIELDVDISNLQNGMYNDYDIHDKVYVKLPGTSELITARVTETSKEANNIAANTIKISNYTNTTLKQITNNTIINASNTSFKYPSSKELTVRLENLDYNSEDPYSVQYPANKLISFTLYKVADGSRTWKRVYTKRTNAYGYAKLNMKYNPGEWELDIAFGGDEEYNESTTTIKVNVSGTLPQKKKNKSSTKSKTTKKTEKTVEKTTYYDKYGRSPDKKKILAIGKKSASGDDGDAGVFYGQEFKNKCPHCGKESLAWGIFYAGNEYSNWGTFPATGNREGGSAEGHIFCTNQRCDADYSCQGHEHIGGGKRLTTTKKRFKSSKADAYKLKKGQYIYNKVSTSNSSKNNSNTKTRKVIGKISAKVKQKALDIVGDKTGYQAMRAICDWMDKNVDYVKYSNFRRSPAYVMKHGGNCCDQTRLILQLFDGAGLTEYYDMYYVNLQCPSYGHVYGRLKSKKNKKWVNIDPASDAYGCYAYVCDSCSRTSPVDSKYPNLPF